ncbi:hypothetical protein A4G99_18340 [Haladaptatus sp. R4]|uniref:hypothetical protein n=1 Tax=Haladaptatus sp. R4 TaxID=1679489 RepID=UPI0007B486AB|nr:hypothetical protein [Haladaptatus sp. R4]KZN22718.1 hypothetical protein A4G99_18340 [Haladaptatus sp. R4]
MTVPTRRPDSDQHSGEKIHDDTSITYHFVCEFCDEVLETESIDGMYDRGTAHLEDHRNDLLVSFVDGPRRNRCENDCGCVLPIVRDDVDGFECPDCGHDNFGSLARRHLYWEMELISP